MHKKERLLVVHDQSNTQLALRTEHKRVALEFGECHALHTLKKTRN